MPSTLQDQPLSLETARVQGQRHTVKSGTETCTCVLETLLVARRNVSGARGGATPLGVSLAEMDGAVLLAHDKSLLIFSILSRKLRPTPGEKERPAANAFPQQGYSLRLLTSGKGLSILVCRWIVKLQVDLCTFK